ncbi:MAG: TrpR-related protein YerC/YecD [Clostridia bacterium]|nr:TrpR-related protein YerC/YecD [Clostridia bacterium]
MDRLFTAILDLENMEDCYRFFDDVCTIKELQDMAQRLEAAVLLSEGENYLSVSQKAGISTATISRVSRCLQYGSGGYQKAIRKLKTEGKA